jgi:hypothetical protein
LAAFQREGGNWVDYVASPIMTLFMAVQNVIIVAVAVHAAGLLVLRRSPRISAGTVA